MTDTAQAADVAARVLDPAAERLAADVDLVLGEHGKTLKHLGKPGDWLVAEEHARRVAAAEAKLHGALDELWTDAEAKAEARVSAAAEALAPYALEPWERLTGEELGRANSLRGFVSEAVEGASLLELAEALKARTRGKDRGALAVWLQACYVRYRQEERAAPAMGRPPRGLSELGEAIRAAVLTVEGEAVTQGRAKAKAAEDTALQLRGQIARLKAERDPRERRRFADRMGLRYTG